MTDQTRRILLGRVHGAFGVRGEVKLESLHRTACRDPALPALDLARRAGGMNANSRAPAGARPARAWSRRSPASTIATPPRRCAAVDDLGAAFGAAAAASPASTTGSTSKACAWSTREGVDFGTVSHLFSTGANDVLVARGRARADDPVPRAGLRRSRSISTPASSPSTGTPTSRVCPMRIDVVSLFPEFVAQCAGSAWSAARRSGAAGDPWLEPARLRRRQLSPRRRPPIRRRPGHGDADRSAASLPAGGARRRPRAGQGRLPEPAGRAA